MNHQELDLNLHSKIDINWYVRKAPFTARKQIRTGLSLQSHRSLFRMLQSR